MKSKELMNKMYSQNQFNYKIVNHFINLGIIVQVQRGVYKLSDKVQDALSKIQKEMNQP